MAQEHRLNIRPVSFNPVVDGATDTYFGFVVRDAQAEVDLTGYTAKMEIRPYRGAKRVYDTLTTENGRISIDKGTIRVHFPAEVTKGYTFSKAEYDLIVVSMSGYRYRIIEGTVEFNPGVTQ